MTWKIEEIEKDMAGEKYYFILHKFDSVVVGEKIEGNAQYKELKEAVVEENILELHLFNRKREVFLRRENEELDSYKVLEHSDGCKKTKVIERKYELENRISGYDFLIVKEYIKHDEKSLAYVDKTILYKLGRKSNG
ncbi:MAG: hypothetical protein COA82_03335 [Alkaliphilus sp.]|nr:hypothetical protein [bacterium AH-315-E09]PHS35839.1 MAG: hypothetical protein COA82_03335 [Alkaliphilus sp.]